MFRRNQFGDVTRISTNPLCCYAVSLWTDKERLHRMKPTRFILLSRTAESSATSGYVVVPERFGQSEARAGRNVERTKRKPNLIPSIEFIL